MELTRIVCVCLSVLLLSHMLLAHPPNSRDDDITDLEDDVQSLVQDVMRLMADSRHERQRAIAEDDERRVRRYIHFSLRNDHTHNRPSRRRRIHHDRQRNGGVRLVKV